MEDHKQRPQRGGIGVLGLLGVAFVVLKLTGHIDWSWWLVTAPFWVLPAGVIAFLLFGGIFVAIEAWASGQRAARRNRR